MHFDTIIYLYGKHTRGEGPAFATSWPSAAQLLSVEGRHVIKA